jgi:hypothetical protein
LEYGSTALARYASSGFREGLGSTQKEGATADPKWLMKNMDEQPVVTAPLPPNIPMQW